MKLALTRHRAAIAFWHLLFLDVFVMSWRFGGIAIVDALIHCLVLVAATGLLWVAHARREVPKPFWWAAGLLLGTAVLLLVPLPESLFRLLAPVKHEIVTATTAIYPSIPFSHVAAVMPRDHLLRTMLMVMDLYLVLLLLIAPTPKRSPVPLWTTALSICLGGLTLAVRYTAAAEGWLSPWKTSVGGLINDNHFAVLAVVLILLETWFLIEAIGRKAGTHITVHAIALVIVLAAFLEAWSRAGLVLLFLGLVVWGGITLLEAWRRPGGFRQAAMILGPLTGLVLIGGILFFFSASGAKLRAEGFEIDKRIDMNRTAIEFLGDGQLFGTGLGSVIGLVDQRMPRTIVYDLRIYQVHNEYLQILLELGLPGFAGLLILLFLILEPLFSHADRHPRGQVGMLWAIVAVFAVHSLLEFPLRLLSIRTFALLVLCGMIAEAEPVRVTVRPKRAAMIPALICLLVATIYLADYLWRIPPPSNLVDDSHRHMTYGRPHRVNLREGIAIMDRLLWQGVPVDEAGAEIARARRYLYASLEEWPLNMEAMNLLFMAELLEHRIEDPGFDRQTFLEFERRAMAIGALSHPSAPRAKLARFFLYALYLDYLDEEEKQRYNHWKQTLWLLLRKSSEPADTQVEQTR